VTADFRIASGADSDMLVLIPLSEAAKRWAKAHLPVDARARSDLALVEPRYAVVIIDEVIRPEGPVN
jgi:hypothetical protein